MNELEFEGGMPGQAGPSPSGMAGKAGPDPFITPPEVARAILSGLQAGAMMRVMMGDPNFTEEDLDNIMSVKI